MKLKITHCFPSTLETKGNYKSVAADVCCAKNDPQDKYLGDIFYQTAPIPQWRTLDQTLVLL